MGKQQPQIEMFPPPPLTVAEEVDARIARARAERFAREATKPTAITRESVRSRRKRDVRARTVSMKRMTKTELALGRALYPLDEEADAARPRVRSDCDSVPRPCPYVSCRHHLYLDVSARTGAIKLNFPDLEPHELPADRSCTLDTATKGGTTLEDVGAIMNLTRERIRQVEVKALAKAEAAIEAYALRDFWGEGPAGKRRRLPLLEQREEDAELEPEFDADVFSGPTLDEA